ncbi:hypothetical protein [Rhodovulum visakhapatnamense]|uniref:Uncharacterized protein n=1 Tax=Rhodovulum visakhapatnamense TaxID=364297 RepID=A0A4R8F8B0_9RHOB|nr:hypothetical protein [Rhodovulum visakhapatnamense]TDX19718.1 hypothetical protein EV657_1567 [Rhodovulum visakhapatnamense]
MIEATDSALRTLLAILGALVLVWLRTDGMALVARMGIVIASGAIGYVAGPEIALWLGTPEQLTIVGVTVLGPLALETAAAALLWLKRDPAHLAEMLRLWRGGK